MTALHLENEHRVAYFDSDFLCSPWILYVYSLTGRDRGYSYLFPDCMGRSQLTTRLKVTGWGGLRRRKGKKMNSSVAKPRCTFQ